MLDPFDDPPPPLTPTQQAEESLYWQRLGETMSVGEWVSEQAREVEDGDEDG